MPKKLFWIALIVLLVSLLIPIILRLTTPQETATVRFKEAIIESAQPDGEIVKKDEISGEVTKKDKYVVIKSEDGGRELVFTWEQIKSITETRQVRSKQVDDVIDWIEFVSKMGILAAIIIFLVGLYQYQQGQKWKREEFLATAVKEFGDSLSAGNARRMLDALRLYKHIEIKFYQDKELEKVSRDEILDALDTDTEREFNSKAIEIRDCFDSYFNYLERFEHYIQNDLVSKNSVYTYLNYQITLLGASGKLKEENRERILEYADFFEFPGVKALLGRYKKDLRKKNYSDRSSAKLKNQKAPSDSKSNTDMQTKEPD